MALTTKRSKPARVALSILVAFLLPSTVCWLGAIVAAAAQSLITPFAHASLTLAGTVQAILFGMMLGFGLGWPFVLGAVFAWVILFSLGRHHLWAAGLVGLITGAAFLCFARGLVGDNEPEYERWMLLLCLPTGLITGCVVWWIAYRRQDRLFAPPIITRPPLNL